MTKLNTGLLMTKTMVELIRDFRVLLKDPSFAADAQHALSLGIPEFRKLSFRVKGEYFTPAAWFKCHRQVEHFFKRFRFVDDMYTDDELELQAIADYVQTQARVLAINERPFTTRSKIVLDKAKEIVQTVLGPYDEELSVAYCRFSKRATVGNPYARSYLDRKLGTDLITGSPQQLKWFEDYLVSDPLLARAMDECVPFLHWKERMVVVNAVPLECVPKSWKSLRTIRKNTLIGAFRTKGIGRLIEERLRMNAGLDISRGQNRHRKMVLPFSRTRTHATGDVSKASDSFSRKLVEYLLPKDWFDAIEEHRIPLTKLENGAIIENGSYMTMGEGHTFPLQTLLFYAILESIRSLLKADGFVSVYGDDLIYPTVIHRFVRDVLADLGIFMNQDKTFTWENFRESCGEDAYLGVPCRPYSPEGSEREGCGKYSYQALLYKMINGLLERWKPSEIPGTLWFLYLELSKVASVIYQVPVGYPSFSGIRVTEPQDSSLFPWSPVEVKLPTKDHGWKTSFCFEHLAQAIPKVPALGQSCFLREALNRKDSDYRPILTPFVKMGLSLREINNLPGPFEDFEDIPCLHWSYQKTRPWTSSTTGQKFRYRLIAKYMQKGTVKFTRSTSELSISWEASQGLSLR